MKTEIKHTAKKAVLWTLAILSVLLLVALALMIAFHHTPAPIGTGETRPSGTVSTTEPQTEETEPLIPVNPYGPEDFGFDGNYLSCLAGECMVGIDVSTWQGEVDWNQVRDAGISFVMIRGGYRGTELGALFEDDMAQSHYAGAKEAGLKVGAYFFSQAITPEEAREEAIYLMHIVKDWELDMPLVYDWEYIDDESRTANVDARLLTDCTLAFCREVEKKGYESMVYFNPNQAHKLMYLEELTDHQLWLAMYDSAMTYPHKVHMWQYTNQGSVPGIYGNVDINLYFLYD